MSQLMEFPITMLKATVLLGSLGDFASSTENLQLQRGVWNVYQTVLVLLGLV